jgi:hypothetical protein
MRLVLSAAAIAGVLSALGTIQASAPAIYLQFYLLIPSLLLNAKSSAGNLSFRAFCSTKRNTVAFSKS